MPAVLDLLFRAPPRAAHTDPVLAGNLEARFARHQDDVEAAQRLRWQVFHEEPGARVEGAPDRLDRDRFDPFCDHLLVRERDGGRVVGTCRVLRPEQARRLGQRCIEQEFDVSALRPILDDTVELGRSCVDPAWRQGPVIMLLWSALARFLDGSRYTHALGCVSVPMADGGLRAASLWAKLAPACLSDPGRRIRPHRPLVTRLCGGSVQEPPVPPLVKGYLRAGASILGVPHVDGLSGCADFPMLVDVDRLSPRYARRFLPSGG